MALYPKSYRNSLFAIQDQLRAGDLLASHGYLTSAIKHYEKGARLLRRVLSQLSRAGNSSAAASPEATLVQKIAALTLVNFPDAMTAVQQFLEHLREGDTKQSEQKLQRIHLMLFFMLDVFGDLTEKKKRRTKKTLSFFSIGILTAFIALGYGKLIDRALHPPASDVHWSPQTHYRGLANQNQKEVMWVEFGKEGKLVSFLIKPPQDKNYHIYLKDFTIKSPWSLPSSQLVRWHVKTKHEGKINLVFPKWNSGSENAQFDSVALFLTDGNSDVRSVMVTSAEKRIVVDSLRSGKWVILPVTSKEAQRGAKRIKVKPLTGDGAALSALVLLKTNRAAKAKGS